MSTSNVTQKGQVTIPVALRNELGLKSGSKVRFARDAWRMLKTLFKIRFTRYEPSTSQAELRLP